MLHRRRVLELLAVAPFAAAPVAGCAAGPDPAAAWRDPGAGETDPRRFALAHAILAPNPHNRQPWLASLEGADDIVLHVDLDRRLPETDPFDRQIVLGCGAFLELLSLAAAQDGRRAEITPWPEGEPQPRLDGRPVARVRLVADPAAPKDPLFGQILKRHTNRTAYEARVPETAGATAVLAAAEGPGLSAGVVSAPAEVAALRDLAWRAWLVEAGYGPTHMESVNLIRIGSAEIARHRDGISLDGLPIEAMSRLGLLTREQLADPESMASKQGEDMWRAYIEATPAFFWMKGADNSRATQVAAGRAYARAHLAATAQGLQMQPWSMSLQEFAPMSDLYRATQARLGATAEAPVQMLVRIGYAKAAAPAPRRGLAEHLVT